MTQTEDDDDAMMMIPKKKIQLTIMHADDAGVDCVISAYSAQTVSTNTAHSMSRTMVLMQLSSLWPLIFSPSWMVGSISTVFNLSSSSIADAFIITPLPTITGTQQRTSSSSRRFTDDSSSSLLSSPKPRSRSLLRATSPSHHSTELPSIEQLSKDPFMKQVEHGFALTSALLWHQRQQNNKQKNISDDCLNESSSSSSESSTQQQQQQQLLLLQEAIQAQLSHAEGIRGFMVSYLTADESPANDPSEEIPKPLLDALRTRITTQRIMKSSSSAASSDDDLVSLTCMNVIMPTAMVTMHQTAELSAGSARTARRGIRILKALLLLQAEEQEQEQEQEQEAPPPKVVSVLDNVRAIFAVASGSTMITPAEEEDVVVVDGGGEVKAGRAEDVMVMVDPKLFKYWTDFFEKWGYQEVQRADIAKAMKDIIEQASSSVASSTTSSTTGSSSNC